jgi:hypothetical protein
VLLFLFCALPLPQHKAHTHTVSHGIAVCSARIAVNDPQKVMLSVLFFWCFCAFAFATQGASTTQGASMLLTHNKEIKQKT